MKDQGVESSAEAFGESKIYNGRKKYKPNLFKTCTNMMSHTISKTKKTITR